MTKEVLGQVLAKTVPVIGAVVSGGLTFAMFNACCERLKATLQDTMLSNPTYQPEKSQDDLILSDEDCVVEEATEDMPVEKRKWMNESNRQIMYRLTNSL